jgi:hypothetical protein
MASVVDRGGISEIPTLTIHKLEFQKTISTPHGFSIEHISTAG